MNNENNSLVVEYIDYIKNVHNYKISYNPNMSIEEVNAILSLRFSPDEISVIQNNFISFKDACEKYANQKENEKQVKKDRLKSFSQNIKTKYSNFLSMNFMLKFFTFSCVLGQFFNAYYLILSVSGFYGTYSSLLLFAIYAIAISLIFFVLLKVLDRKKSFRLLYVLFFVLNVAFVMFFSSFSETGYDSSIDYGFEAQIFWCLYIIFSKKVKLYLNPPKENYWDYYVKNY